MKVTDLRVLLKQGDPALVQKAFVETYKMLSAQKKEEADTVIRAVLSGEDLKKSKAEQTIADFPTLKQEIKKFFSDADNDYYIEPNRVVSKKDRPKWRFKVKNYLKALNEIPENDPNYREAGQLQLGFYWLLTNGCQYYVFHTENPFRSIGITQWDLFYQTAEHLLRAEQYSRECMAKVLEIVSTSAHSPDTINDCMLQAFSQLLKTPDLRYLAIELATQNLETIRKKANGKKLSWDTGRQAQMLDEIVLWNAMCLSEVDPNTIQFFYHNSTERSADTALYRALQISDRSGHPEFWILFYEYSVNTLKIKPRESMEKHYQERKKENSKQ